MVTTVHSARHLWGSFVAASQPGELRHLVLRGQRGTACNVLSPHIVTLRYQIGSAGIGAFRVSPMTGRIARPPPMLPLVGSAQNCDPPAAFYRGIIGS
jgi:hypothetical protein